ncbi:MAG TPA: GNAT family N-acetyltransferase [Candidatus Coproplasma stercoripullorum]|uniref:GNAT family N-acetyltransferase n=1 Tax=Candidatus Coproplasma stercoripullorum TaxID=2840751 RepID=A0A9D1AIF5_9FIRM|nr:GNAT family N-acetyltransferase [Candidatus Coproplasma stercoripullorum]
MTVRKAENRDIPAIINLLKQVNEVHAKARPDLFKLATKYSAEEVKGLISGESTPIFVADEGGKVLGYAMCKLIVHSGESIMQDMKSLYIDDICVDEGARGRHVGTEIYSHVLAFAKDIGCYNITLNVWACNPEAEAFYKKLGLVPQKTTMEKII